MPETVETCPLCRSGASRPFAQVNFRGQAARYRVCAACGFVFQSPRMTGPELDAFYAEEYRRIYQGAAGPGAKDLAVQRGRALALSAFLAGELGGREAGGDPLRHLDIGCSSGLLLQQARQAWQTRPVGIEPGTAYREHARVQGLEVYESLEALEAAGEPPFDLVSLAHVLEHLPDPVGYLAHLRESLLAPGGLLLLETPNLYAHESFEIAHLAAFSAHTLAETVRQAGYTVVRTQAHGRPRSELLPLYITMLARPLAQPPVRPVIPERSPALKRRLGMLRRRALTRLFPAKAWLKEQA